MSSAEPVIAARGLSHWFGRGEARSQVLHDVDLDLHAGELVVLRGASGSGKTTLLTLLACLREVETGSVRLLGRELRGARANLLVGLRRDLGVIFQAHNLHPALTAIENVRMGLDLHGVRSRPQRREAAAHVLALLGLEERVDYRPAKLSGGQRQRVAIARALVGDPRIVFADEPTAALDAGMAGRTIDLLRRLGAERGTSTLLISHDPAIVARADRVITLSGGRVA